jgi:hypothetical protein
VLRSDLTTVGIVDDALGAALWSSDAALSGAAAAYLASRGDIQSPGVIRGLVRAIPDQHRRRWNPEALVEAHLLDVDTQATTIGALGAVLFDDGGDLSYTAVRLLLTNGVPATPRVIDVLDYMAQSGNVLGPLALLASVKRVEEVRDAVGACHRALITILSDAPA